MKATHLGGGGAANRVTKACARARALAHSLMLARILKATGGGIGESAMAARARAWQLDSISARINFAAAIAVCGGVVAARALARKTASGVSFERPVLCAHCWH